ncbi:MAG TPA: phage holin family protein [Gammaproteobacteria bacterium]
MALGPHTPPDEAPAAAAGPAGGLLRSVGRLLATLVAIAQTRVELLTTELQAEMHSVAQIMLWTLVALLAAAMGLFLTALGIVFVFWDTHRLAAAAGVTAAFFAIAVAALLVLRTKVRSRPPLLGATLAELARDREQLASRVGAARR